jgi:hypothetical protein
MGTPMMAVLRTCHSIFHADFRSDLRGITVPALVIHGTADQDAVPALTGRRAADLLANSLYKEYQGTAHGLFLTHKDELNADLLLVEGADPGGLAARIEFDNVEPAAGAARRGERRRGGRRADGRAGPAGGPAQDRRRHAADGGSGAARRSPGRRRRSRRVRLAGRHTHAVPLTAGAVAAALDEAGDYHLARSAAPGGRRLVLTGEARVRSEGQIRDPERGRGFAGHRRGGTVPAAERQEPGVRRQGLEPRTRGLRARCSETPF